MEELISGEGFVGLAHGLEDEVIRRRIGGNTELGHLGEDIKEVSGGGTEHEVGPEVVVEEANIGAIGLAVLVEGVDPGLEVVPHLGPVLGGDGVGEGVEEAAGVGVVAAVGAEGGEGVGGGGGGG